ncbi:hypothetical protein PASLES2_16280 [Pseudomonas aeruginosa]
MSHDGILGRADSDATPKVAPENVARPERSRAR